MIQACSRKNIKGSSKIAVTQRALGFCVSVQTSSVVSTRLPVVNSSWLQQTPLPVAKWGGRAVTCHEWLVIIGGGVGELACKRVFAFNALRQQWSQWTDTPFPESAIAADGLFIYAAGGRPCTTAVYFLKPPLPGEKAVWESLDKVMIWPVQNAVAVVHQRTLFVLSSASFQCFPEKRRLWRDIHMPNAPHSLSEFSELPSCLVPIGCRLMTDAGWLFDTDQWKWLPCPVVRYGCCMTEYNGWLLVIGGQDASQQSSPHVHALHADSGQWQRLPDLSVPRVFASASVLCGAVYVCGGYWQDESQQRTGLTSVECLW